MKYFVIKSLFGNIECYWNSNMGIFGLFVKSTKFVTYDEAHQELIDKASFVEPSHVLEVTDKSNLLSHKKNKKD
jgi:hypothetical protein